MRARNVKPDLFKNEILAECDPLARLLFVGLWCMADKDGYLEYRPKRIGAEILPYDSRNIEKFLEQLSTRGFITIWCVKDSNGEKRPAIIDVPNFKKHQNPHKNEKPSKISHLFYDQETSRNFVKLHEIYQTDPADSGFLIPDSGFLIPECCGEEKDTSPPPEQFKESVIKIPLTASEGEYEIYQEDIYEWEEAYPAIDVLQALRNIREWNLSNPKNRKTKTGIRKHITGWMAKEQNRAPKVRTGGLDAYHEFIEQG